MLFDGFQYPVTLFGMNFEIPHQGLAVPALLPIWLYNDERGPYNKVIQLLWYALYLIHMAVPAGIWLM